MAVYLLLSMGLGIVWMGLTSQTTLENYLVGVVMSLSILAFVRFKPPKLRWSRLPSQIGAALVYMLLLFRDIVLSSIDVTRRVLSPTIPLNPGIVAVTTQDPEHDPMICALSSDIITLTPGELVVDVEDNFTMYVHALDVDATLANIEQVQARRLTLMKRILGRD